MLRYLLVVLLLAGCGTTESTTFSTIGDEMTAPAEPTPSSSPTADPAAVDETRAIVRGGISAATRQIKEWQGRITTLRDHAITRQYEDALAAIGEEMLEWVEEQQVDLEGADTGPCIEESLTAYQAALDELVITTDRLFEAGQAADVRVVRGLAALDDAADALDAASTSLPQSCRSD